MSKSGKGEKVTLTKGLLILGFGLVAGWAFFQGYWILVGFMGLMMYVVAISNPPPGP